MKDIIAKHEAALQGSGRDVHYLSYDEAFAEDDSTEGYKWRLNELNKAWGPIKPQQLYVVMATTHTGKSSFVISESLHMLRQAKNRNILYFNNERGEKSVLERYMCGIFRKDSDKIRQNRQKVREIFEHNFPGEPLKIFSARDGQKSMREIERACNIYQPAVVVIDQLDKLVSEKDRGGRRPYEKVYAWARNLAVKYNTPVIGVTQYGVSTDQHGQIVNKKMHQHGTFDAKIDKAANTDYLLGIQNVGDSKDMKRIYLIRAKEGDEGIDFICKFNAKTGLYDNI
jgi:KaiC/GvpD/RAD55 family RecA-like ATPase